MTEKEFKMYKVAIEHMDDFEKKDDYRKLLVSMNLRMVLQNKPPITEIVENAINKARAVN